jgi:hypothetical protein
MLTAILKPEPPQIYCQQLTLPPAALAFFSACQTAKGDRNAPGGPPCGFDAVLRLSERDRDHVVCAQTLIDGLLLISSRPDLCTCGQPRRRAARIRGAVPEGLSGSERCSLR